MVKIKKWFWRALILGGVVGVLTLLNFSLVEQKSANNIQTALNDLPDHHVALVLGTSKYLLDGQVNLFYQYRIQAAWDVYRAGKAQYLLLSGDNGTYEYNEPAMMREDLIELGVPGDRIYLDYAGFRTLDSVIRAKSIFGQSRFICISQSFHLARAIYIGRSVGIDIVGYPARSVSPTYGRTVQVREYLARVKMQLDLLFGKEPRFYGPPIQIG